MEQYIKLLSDIDPGWMQDSSVVSISCIEFEVLLWIKIFQIISCSKYLFNFQDDGKQEFIGSKLTGSPDTEKALLEDVRGDAGDQR